MAYCKNLNYLVIQKGSEFDDLHMAGTIAPLSGVYRCESCGLSIVAHNGYALPDDLHHPHPNEKPILWRLVVRSHLA